MKEATLNDQIHTDKNVADLITKAFDVSRFQYLIANIRMLNLKVFGINLLLLLKVNAARHKLTAAWKTVLGYCKTVNGEVQLQTLVDGKKVIITKTSVRRDLQLEDAKKGIRVNAGDSKLILLGINLLLLVRKQKSRKSKKKNTKVSEPSRSTDNVLDKNVPTTSNDPLLSDEDRLKLAKLIDLCTNLQKKVLDLEKAKTAQDSEIASLKKKVKKLERRNKSRTLGLKRLRKVGSARRVESSDESSLGDQEDASKQRRKIANIDADAEITLIDETQERNDDNLMFDTGVLDEQEVDVKKIVSSANVTTKSATTTIVDELTLTQTLIDIKAAKPKVRGVMIQEPSKFTITTTTTPAASKPSQDKGKEKIIKFEKSLKKKDYIMYNQEDITQAIMDADYQIAQQLQAEEQEQPEKGYESVLWGDLKTMFEHHIEDEVWRSLQGEKVLLWRLYDSCGVHFVRFKDMHVYMIVEKRYQLTPATITDMLNKKLKFEY
ncbi:hypothetical protein Tco_0955959 [Tanacetum coccineum]|uniref:Uncharacterized protein n=1 Tax=Tanacetum coccineum TaxID=301880 RepID=A0ABQ5E8Q2_9ASTR